MIVPFRRSIPFSLALVLLAWSPAHAAGEFDGEWQGFFLSKSGCTAERQTLTMSVRNYVVATPLGRGGLPVISTIRGDNSLNLFWGGDRYLSGTFHDNTFKGEAGFGTSTCRIALERTQAPEPGPGGPYDGAWRLVSVDGCLAGYNVDAAIYVSGEEVTGIATGWLTEEFTGKMADDGRFQASANRYRLSGQLPRTAGEVTIDYENVAGDCQGTVTMTRRIASRSAEREAPPGQESATPPATAN